MATVVESVSLDSQALHRPLGVMTVLPLRLAWALVWSGIASEAWLKAQEIALSVPKVGPDGVALELSLIRSLSTIQTCGAFDSDEDPLATPWWASIMEHTLTAMPIIQTLILLLICALTGTFLSTRVVASDLWVVWYVKPGKGWVLSGGSHIVPPSHPLWYSSLQPRQVGEQFELRINPETRRVEYGVRNTVLYTSRVAVQYPLTATVSFGSSNAEVYDFEWIGSTSCNASANCSALNRYPCFANDVCGACIYGFVGGDTPSNDDSCTIESPVVGEAVQWQNTVGVEELSESRGLVSTDKSWGRSGAVSRNSFTAESTVTGVRFKITQTNVLFMVGLNHGPGVLAYAHYQDLDHAIYVANDGYVSFYENGRQVFSSPEGYTVNSTFEIRYNHLKTAIEYVQDGRVEYRSLGEVSFPLTAGVSFNSQGAQVVGLEWTGPVSCSEAGINGSCAALSREPCYNDVGSCCCFF